MEMDGEDSREWECSSTTLIKMIVTKGTIQVLYLNVNCVTACTDSWERFAVAPDGMRMRPPHGVPQTMCLVLVGIGEVFTTAGPSAGRFPSAIYLGKDATVLFRMRLIHVSWNDQADIPG